MKRTFTAQHIKNLSVSHKGKIPWNKGRKNVYSKETLNKISESRKKIKGWKHSEKTKLKISIALTGRIISTQTKKILSENSARLSGKNHPNWKGGRRVHCNGYVWLFIPEHPYKSAQGYVLEHRVIMEKYIGRNILPEEVIHHIDKNPRNNRIENLILFKNASEHIKYHHLNERG